MNYSSQYLVCIGLLLFSCGLIYSPAHAESCWIGGATLSLGTANLQGSSTASTDVTITCNSNWSQPVTYKMCLVIDSTDPSGNEPRSMINYNPAALLNYHLYYDASRSHKIPGSDRINQAQCQTFQVESEKGSKSTQIKIYGQVLSGQKVPAQAYKTNSVNLKLYSAFRYGSDAPTNIETLASRNIETNNMVVNANYENSCLIQSATDIDFGAVEHLNNPLMGYGSIQLACPTGASMQVSLDNGINAQGQQRRMRNVLGDYIRYNLYRDASRSQTWQGNVFYAVDSQTIPVYAAVPVQPISSVGQYSDTITVTLTY
jgi:spore coat protein U-like protein